MIFDFAIKCKLGMGTLWCMGLRQVLKWDLPSCQTKRKNGWYNLESKWCMDTSHVTHIYKTHQNPNLT